jgi:hypothetical protein
MRWWAMRWWAMRWWAIPLLLMTAQTPVDTAFQALQAATAKLKPSPQKTAVVVAQQNLGAAIAAWEHPAATTVIDFSQAVNSALTGVL